MRIALNVSILNAQRTGIGNYVFELARALRKYSDIDLVCFNQAGIVNELDFPLKNYSYKSLLRNVPGAYRARRYLASRKLKTIESSLGVDIYHEPSLWPIDSKCPCVSTVHDLTHVHFPETQPKSRLQEINRRFEADLHKTKGVIVDSSFVSHELQKIYNVPPSKITVIPLGLSKVFRRRIEDEIAPLLLDKFKLKVRRYLLSVGTLEPRKNLIHTLQAYEKLPVALKKIYPLVIVGAKGWEDKAISSELRKALNSGYVIFTGYLCEEDLSFLYSGARAVLYPSLYEGFGLPALEALASGAPLITTDTSALPEVCGEAAIYISGKDVTDYSEKIQNLVENDLTWFHHSEMGVERAKSYSWELCAKKTLLFYKKILEL